MDLYAEMSSIYRYLYRIARYFCVDIGIDLAYHECIVYRYRFSIFFV